MCEQRRITVAEQGISRRTGRNANRGFTLVELLVVVAIIALLMSILMPALRRVKMQAQEVACRSNTKQVGLILYMHLQENEFFMPHCWEIDYSGVLGANYTHSDTKANGYFWRHAGVTAGPIVEPLDDTGLMTYWATTLKPYVKETKVFGCPAFKNALEMAEIDKLYGADVKEFYDTAFAMNAYLDWANVNSIKSQGDVIVCSDHLEPRIEQADDTGNHNDCFCPGRDGKPLSHYRFGDRTEWYRGILRHNIKKDDPTLTGGRANILWLDNHVSVIEEEEILNLEVPNRSYDPLWKELDPSW
jgi:prepilin-type N-terminal cleavage/methylation domain-containing protein/prepilin-type processing-associated H-X9-DG protein